MGSENKLFTEYIKESYDMLLQNKKNTRQVFEGCFFFLPSLVSYLPIEIKALIIRFLINKSKHIPLFNSFTLFEDNFQTILAFCGRDYYKVIEYVFRKPPSFIHKFYDTRIRKLKDVIDNINDEDIILYAKFKLKESNQLTSKKWILKMYDTNRFDFKLLNKRCLDAKTLYFHKSSPKPSTFKNYFREGFWLNDKFTTVHYVNSKYIKKIKL